MVKARQIEVSPSFEKDTLFYYEGDTFDIEFEFELRDHTGLKFNIEETDTISFEFKNSKGKVVYKATYSDIENNTVVLDWPAEVSNLFEKGLYFYRIRFESGYTTTIIADFEMVVL